MVLMVEKTTTYERELTIEERCMTTVMYDTKYSTEYRDAVAKHLKECGFRDRRHIGCHTAGHLKFNGVFERVEIRPASPNEAIAYYYLKMIYADDPSTMCASRIHDCKECVFTSMCPSTIERRNKAKDTIKGLEFFESGGGK